MAGEFLNDQFCLITSCLMYGKNQKARDSVEGYDLLMMLCRDNCSNIH